MSSFPAGSISSSLNFDTSSWTGGFAEVISTATSFPALVATNLDAPMANLAPVMAAAAESIATSAQQAGVGIYSGIGGGVTAAAAELSAGLEAPMEASAAQIAVWAAEAGASIQTQIAQGVSEATAAVAELPPAMESAAHQAAGSAHEAGESIGHEIEHGMLSAEAAMRLFPPLVIELIENPVLGAVAAAKEALEALGETVEGVAARFHAIGLAAEKSGLDPEVFSTYAAAAKASGVDVEQFGNAIKFMEDRAANALRGDESGAKAFTDLGISATELASLLSSPQQMLLRVSEAIAAIENPAQRVQAAMDLMSRAGTDLLPFLAKGPEEIQRLAAEMGHLGAGVSEAQVQMGEGWGLMEARFSAMWQGVKNSLAEPVLAALGDNMDALVGDAKQFFGQVKDWIAEAIPYWETFGGAILSLADPILSVLVPALEILAVILRPIEEIIKLILDGAAIGLAGFGGLINSAIHGADSPEAQTSFNRADAAANRFKNDLGIETPSVNVGSVNVTLDTEKSSEQLARKIEPHIARGFDKLHQQANADLHGEKVRHAMNGKRR